MDDQDLEAALRPRLNAILSAVPTARMESPVRRAGRPQVIARRPLGLTGITLAFLAITLAVLAAGPLANRPTPTGPPTAASQPNPTQETVDGLAVLTVDEAIRLRDSGSLGGRSFALRGYWIYFSLALFCAVPVQDRSPLELGCEDSERQIAQDDAGVGSDRGQVLSPFIADPVVLTTLMSLQGPIPILVVGHFADPGAQFCRPAARAACFSRLVVERVVQLAGLALSPQAGTTLRTVDGLPVRTLYQAQRARDLGTLGSGPFALIAYWSYLQVQYRCGPVPTALGGEAPVCLTYGWVFTAAPITDRSSSLTIDNDPTGYEAQAVEAYVPADVPGSRSLLSNLGPVRVVVVGQFGSLKAQLCPGGAVGCEQLFIVRRIDVVGDAAPADQPSSAPS